MSYQSPPPKTFHEIILGLHNWKLSCEVGTMHCVRKLLDH